jgi:hypothetical protein
MEDLKLVIEIKCTRCNSPLGGATETYERIVISPCEYCLKETEKAGYKRGRDSLKGVVKEWKKLKLERGIE